MAQHSSTESMLTESLQEMFLVAKYAIEFRKNPSEWGSSGCYGYPGALLLFSIADSIGSYVIGGSVRQHFEILNHQDYYNLRLAPQDIDAIYEKYRCLLNHNAALAINAFMDIGASGDPVFRFDNGYPVVCLRPFLEVSKLSIATFLANVHTIVPGSDGLAEIQKR